MIVRNLSIIILFFAMSCIGGCGRSGSGDESIVLLKEIEARIGANVFAGMRVEKKNVVRMRDSYSIWIEFSTTAERQAEFLKNFPKPIVLIALDSVGRFPAGDNPEWWRPEDLPNSGIGYYTIDADRQKAMSLYVMLNEQPPPETRIFVYVLLLD